MRACIHTIDEQIHVNARKSIFICFKFASYIVMQNTTRYVNAREFMFE